MGIVTADLRMGSAFLEEVGDATLQDHAQDRTAPEERQNKNQQPQTERQEVGNRAMILRIAAFNYHATWPAQPIFKEARLRANRYHESTPCEVVRLDQLAGGHFDLQRILSRWDRVVSDITYGPARAVNEGRRATQQLAIYDRRGCGNIFRRMAALSMAAFLHSTRAQAEEYSIAGPKVAPGARETEAIRRLQGRCRKQRSNAMGKYDGRTHTDDNPHGEYYARM